MFFFNLFQASVEAARVQRQIDQSLIASDYIPGHDASEFEEYDTL